MKTKLSSTIQYLDGMHFRGSNGSGHVIDMDSGPADVKTNGLTPMELILHTIGGCSGMDVVNILRKRKLKLNKLIIEVDGVKRDTFPRIYEEINILYRASGDGITLKELGRAITLSMNTYCSVSAMLKGVVNVNWKCEIIENEK